MPLAGKNESLLGKRSKKDIRDFYIFKDKLGTWVKFVFIFVFLWFTCQRETVMTVSVLENMSAQMPNPFIQHVQASR